MTEQVQEGPKWLKELEEKRERRLKVRLGHEAGAGSPCLTCENKCPGLDLHFWRKICKNCKCGKENHDVNDDDIYGWAQFQLLGSKPNKPKKIILPGRKDEVELEWMPKGQNEAVENYLKDLPADLLPIKGSVAAQERKQLLQKQIPLHDIDPTFCHALSDNEIKKMNDYISHVKLNSVGVGHILKLNELLRNKQAALNSKLLSSRAPIQISQLENTILQGVDYAGLLKNDDKIGNYCDKHLQNFSSNQQNPVLINQQNQIPANISHIKDVHYETYQQKNVDNGRLKTGNFNFTSPFNYPPQNIQESKHITNRIDCQNPTQLSPMKDIYCSENYLENQAKSNSANIPNNFTHSNNIKNLPNFAERTVQNFENTQTPTDCGKLINDLHPDMNVNFASKHGILQNSDVANYAQLLDNVLNLKTDNIPYYAATKFNTYSEQQNPTKIGNIKDLAFSTYEPSLQSNIKNENLQSSINAHLLPTNYEPEGINVVEQNLIPTPVNIGVINDIEYPSIKTALQKENIFHPEDSRKNVQFNLIPEEILPNCHRCKKMFEPTAVVIGIDRTDALWHAECFKCTGCNQSLADLMYFYHKESDEIYCGRDYAKIRGIPRCNACDELIFVKEYCLAENSTFHVKHFCCFQCDEPLAGKNYVMDDLQPLCLPCFEKVKAERCNACLEVIKPDEQGANLNGVHFHADNNCFACKMCKKPLLGAKLLLKNNNLYCSAPCFGADTKK